MAGPAGAALGGANRLGSSEESPPGPSEAPGATGKVSPEPKREYIAMLPERTIKRLDSLATREFQSSRQRLLTWLAEAEEQIRAGQAEVQAVADEKEHLEQAWRRLEEEQEALRGALIKARRRLELSEDAFDLLHGALEEGYGKSEIVAVLRLCREARVEPSSLADVVARNLGLSEWAERLRVAAAQGEALRDQAIEQAARMKTAAAQLEAEVGALRAQISQSHEQLAAQQEHLRQVGEALHVLGMVLDVLGDRNVIDLPARDARLVLGTLILIMSQVRPHACGPFVLPPNTRIGRMIPMPIVLTDLVPHLASPADYRRMQQLLAERQAAAEAFRTDGGAEAPAAEEGGPQ
jgi:hypothetical protein